MKSIVLIALKTCNYTPMPVKLANIFLSILFSVSANIFAQAPHIKLLCSPRQDSILLRWAPTTPQDWRLGNKSGYIIERTTVLVGRKVPKEIQTIKLIQIPVKPAPLASWEKYANNKYPAIAAECIFSSPDSIEVSRNPHIAYKKHKNEQQRFSFALFAADQSLITAKLSGLYFADKTAKLGEKYLYKVYLDLPDSILQDTAYAVTGLSEYQPLPKPYDVNANWQDKKVELSWDIRYLKHIYNSYIVEKSEDGGSTFQSITQDATVQLADKGVNPRRMYKTDTLLNNTAQYAYRIRGISAFGELGPPSDTLTGSGRKPLTEAPVITSQEVVENKEVQLEWFYPQAMNEFIEGFKIYRSSKPNGKKTLIYTGNIPAERKYTDKQPALTNYYNIAVYAGLEEKLSPAVSYAERVDSFPPAPPVNILAKADTTGWVFFTWSTNKEEDIDGYRIYSSNNPESEFILLSNSIVKDTTHKIPINLKTLNEKIYYKVKAVDIRGNHSGFSELVTIIKPDVIPPVPPTLKTVEVEENSIALTWVGSPSTDVIEYLIYRKAETDSLFKAISTIALNGQVNNQFTDKEISKGIKYAYYLKAKDDAGLYSKASKIKEAGTVSKTKENIKLKKRIQADKAKLTWNIKTNKLVVGYLVYKREKDGSLRLYGNSETTEFFDENLSPGKMYYYQVRAVYGDGSQSGLSNEIKITM